MIIIWDRDSCRSNIQDYDFHNDDEDDHNDDDEEDNLDADTDNHDNRKDDIDDNVPNTYYIIKDFVLYGNLCDRK